MSTFNHAPQASWIISLEPSGVSNKRSVLTWRLGASVDANPTSSQSQCAADLTLEWENPPGTTLAECAVRILESDDLRVKAALSAATAQVHANCDLCSVICARVFLACDQ